MTSRELYGPAKVGGDTLSWCGRCKRELAHVVVAMLGTRPKRVQCKTCRSEHNYKSATPVTKKSAAKRAPAAPRTTVRAAEYWEQKLAEKGAQPSKDYRPQEAFNPGDILAHPRFGLGIVEAARVGKITVLFRDGEKTLLHQLTT